MSNYVVKAVSAFLSVGMIGASSLPALTQGKNEAIIKNSSVRQEFISAVKNDSIEGGLPQSLEAKEVINSINLKEPISPNSEELSIYLDELLSELLNEDMDTYEKVKTCYDYLLENMKYGRHANANTKFINTTYQQIYAQGGHVECYGAMALKTKQGMCNAYASAFILMVNKLGIEADLVSGYTKSARGGLVVHKWAEMNVDDTVFVFDPQLDQNLMNRNLEGYTVFCKTYNEIPKGRYKKA